MAAAAPTSPRRLLLLLPSLLLIITSLSLAAGSHFEGFDDSDAADDNDDNDPLASLSVRSPPVTQSSPDSTLSSERDTTADPSKPSPAAVSSTFDFWDEDEFEGLPTEPVHMKQQQQQQQPDTPEERPDTAAGADSKPVPDPGVEPKGNVLRTYAAEIACVSFLIVFGINYFAGKKKNENIALAWASMFATKDSILEKNFSLLGVGEGDDSPLLLKEGYNVFKFYASGRRYCQGLLATMELKSRHDLISRVYNMIVPCKDEISFEVYMNDDAMDHVVFALAKKKAAKAMQKELRDLQRFAAILSPPGGRNWVADELAVVSESKEVAGDMITGAVLDQVFGEKTFDKFGKGYISMHFSDQHPGTQKKMMSFKFALPDVNHMADMTRLVALVPYYIDLIGRYKLSPQARSKTEASRLKAAQEAYKELQNTRQEALQKKKAEKRKLLEEAEAKLGAEALQKKEAKERARQMKKGMPKMKISRGH